MLLQKENYWSHLVCMWNSGLHHKRMMKIVEIVIIWVRFTGSYHETAPLEICRIDCPFRIQGCLHSTGSASRKQISLHRNEICKIIEKSTECMNNDSITRTAVVNMLTKFGPIRQGGLLLKLICCSGFRRSAACRWPIRHAIGQGGLCPLKTQT